MSGYRFNWRVGIVAAVFLLALYIALWLWASSVLPAGAATPTTTPTEYTPIWFNTLTPSPRPPGCCVTPANPAWVTRWPPVYPATNTPEPTIARAAATPTIYVRPTLICVWEGCTPGATYSGPAPQP